jgi:hypothetical protein
LKEDAMEMAEAAAGDLLEAMELLKPRPGEVRPGSAWVEVPGCPRGIQGCAGGCLWVCGDCDAHNRHDVFCCGCGAGPAEPRRDTTLKEDAMEDIERRLAEDAAAFHREAASLDDAGFVERSLDAIGAAAQPIPIRRRDPEETRALLAASGLPPELVAQLVAGPKETPRLDRAIETVTELRRQINAGENWSEQVIELRLKDVLDELLLARVELGGGRWPTTSRVGPLGLPEVEPGEIEREFGAHDGDD